MEYPGIHSSLTSWKTAGWHDRANGKGFPVLGHRFENNAVEFQWEDFNLNIHLNARFSILRF